jgi:hypothetical protein
MFPTARQHLAQHTDDGSNLVGCMTADFADGRRYPYRSIRRSSLFSPQAYYMERVGRVLIYRPTSRRVRAFPFPTEHREATTWSVRIEGRDDGIRVGFGEPLCGEDGADESLLPVFDGCAVRTERGMLIRPSAEICPNSEGCPALSASAGTSCNCAANHVLVQQSASCRKPIRHMCGDRCVFANRIVSFAYSC